MSAITDFRAGRVDALKEVLGMLEEMGGADASDDWSKGWDSAIDDLERKVQEAMKVNKHWLYKPKK